MERIRRIDRVQNSGIFQGYCWENGLPDLSRINLLYGRNGTGKTSLADALYRGHPYVSLTVGDAEAGTERKVDAESASFFDRVFVFSEAYVRECHRFEPGESAHSDAILTVGEVSLDTENRLDNLEVRIEQKAAARSEATYAGQGAQKEIDGILRDTSEKVVSAVQKAGGRWQSRSHYSAGTVRAELQGPVESYVRLSDEGLARRTALVQAAKQERIPEALVAVEVPGDLVRRIQEGLDATPATVMLDTLRTVPDASGWVEQGRRLHKNCDTCIFCGGPFTAERRNQIEGHFSDEVGSHQASLRAASTELTKIEAAAKEGIAALPRRGQFYEDLRDQLDGIVGPLQSELAALAEWATVSRQIVDEKASNVLAAARARIAEPPSISPERFFSLCTAHNERARKHETGVRDAAEAVEAHYLALAHPRFVEQTQQKSAAEAQAEEFDRDLKELIEERSRLKNVEGDPLPSAKVMTEEVSRLLGRDELKFEAVDGRYRVIRSGEPAGGLSGGERTAITLVHFFEKVARSAAEDNKAVVVVDDPVSSLDSDIFMGASTYIWNEGVRKEHVEQLIIMTHNFELFRQWDIQCDFLRKGLERGDHRYPQFFELCSEYGLEGGTWRRRPRLVTWPRSAASNRKMIRSEYHHAFISMADAYRRLRQDESLEMRLEAQLLFPNVGRRLLETFLAFKLPHRAGNFSECMREAASLAEDAGYEGDANALRLRLTRYLHAHSHREAPLTWTSGDPDEVATVLRLLFVFMQYVDAGHYNGLCSAVGIDPLELNGIDVSTGSGEGPSGQAPGNPESDMTPF